MVRIRIYANAWVWVHWCGYVCMLTRRRKCVGADTHIRKCGYACTLTRERGGGNAGAGDECGGATGGAVGG